MYKTIVTRKSEVRFETNKLEEMVGKFTAERALRGWKEDFVDKDNGDVITIERNEIVVDKGVLLDSEMLTRINFHLQAGDINSVVVSNRRREAVESPSTYMYTWLVVARIYDKNTKFLLYASSVTMAIDIVKDYIELNFSGGFVLTQIKELPSCVLLNDTLREKSVDVLDALDHLSNVTHDPLEYIEKANDIMSDNGDDLEALDYKFYQIDVTISKDEISHFGSFIVRTKDVDKGMHVIQYYLNAQARENKEDCEISIKIEAAKLFPANNLIEREFSMAYAEK